jgi:hypothetical protein
MKLQHNFAKSQFLRKSSIVAIASGFLFACSKKKGASSEDLVPAAQETQAPDTIVNTATTEESPSSQSNSGTGLLPVNVSGNILNLGTQRITLSVNGANPITVQGVGNSTPFEFVGKVSKGSAYVVSISSQPTFPTVSCIVNLGSGTANDNVTNVQVVCPELLEVQVTSSKTSLNINNSLLYKATAIYKNGTTRDLGSAAAWSSSDTNLATLSAQGTLSALAVGTVSVQAGFGGKLGAKSLQIKNVVLSSISLSPQPFSLCSTCTRNLKATGTYSDGSTEDVTSLATFTSNQPAVAQISDSTASKGLVTGVDVGSVTFTAQIGGVSRTLNSTVTNKSLLRIEVGPAVSSGPLGSQQNLQATAVYSDSTFQDVTNEATWTTSNPDLVFVENNVAPKGRVTREAQGTASIQATYSGMSGNASTTISGLQLVSLQFATASINLPTGWEYPLQVDGVYSDGSTVNLTGDVVWQSSATNFVSVSNAASNKGELFGLAPGGASVAAQLGNVSASISVVVANATLNSISVTPLKTLLSAGINQNYFARGTFSNGTSLDITKLATWSLSTAVVGEMSNDEDTKGLFYNQYPTNSANSLEASVRATLSSISGSTTVVVTPNTLQSVRINPVSLTLPTASSQVFRAYGSFSDGASLDITDYVLWESSDTSIFQVSNGLLTKGQASSIAEGTSTVVATLNGTASSPSTVTVSNTLPAELLKQGVGLKAEYFADKTLTPAQLRGTRIDRNVNFNWATGNAPLGVGDNFSIRWTGKIKALNTENLTFYTNSDDGVRLYVNNVLVLNNWTDHAVTENASTVIPVTAGQELDVRLEFYENGGFAVIQLLWQSPLISKQTVPMSQMFPQ